MVLLITYKETKHWHYYLIHLSENQVHKLVEQGFKTQLKGQSICFSKALAKYLEFFWLLSKKVIEIIPCRKLSLTS